MKIEVDEPWFAWQGGVECPVLPSLRHCVVVRQRNGRESMPGKHIGQWSWKNRNSEFDIVAYRFDRKAIAESEVNPSQADQVVQEMENVGIAEADKLSGMLDQRGERYGKFIEHAKISQALSSLMRETVGFDRLSADQCEALEMIQHKIARILNGDPNYADSWVDIAGYAKLVADRLNGVER